MSILGKILLVYYILINLVLFLTMGLDKKRAVKNQYRIPEANLFVLALLGGGIGGFLGMKSFHHKTRKISFYIIFGLAVFLHGFLLLMGRSFYIS